MPWQIDKTPYRVWVSEIMLQQTQVQTVIPYFRRFIKRFSTPAALAAACTDDVLEQWAGLGYYARARNLHLAARRICERFDGEVPQRYEELVALPGIGRSTAGAILTLCFNQVLPILDGNVKRVLTRHEDIPGWPGETFVARQLWALSEARLPCRRAADYTQAIMDLGATVCTRPRPRCVDCPVSRDCKARINGHITERPTARPKRRKPTRSIVMLIVTHNGEVLLWRRPGTGIWGGLLCLPEIDDACDASAWCRRQLGVEAEAEQWSTLAHELTHFRFNIKPLAIDLRRRPRQVMEGGHFIWYRIRDAGRAGVPSPVKKLLAQLSATQTLEK